MKNLTLGIALIAGCTLGAVGGLSTQPVMRMNTESDWRARIARAAPDSVPQLSQAALSYAGPTWWQYGNKHYTAEDRWNGAHGPSAEPAYVPAPMPNYDQSADLEQAASREPILEATVDPEPRLMERREAQAAVATAVAASDASADEGMTGSTDAYADMAGEVVVRTAGI